MSVMRSARRAALLGLLAPVLACAGDRAFECSQDDQCALGGVAGAVRWLGVSEGMETAGRKGWRCYHPGSNALFGRAHFPM